MSRAIETNTLRDWLESHQPVTVLDVRSDEDRAQWAIPGSLHINAYESLKAGQPGALAGAILPHDRPVITVCNAGRVSETAAAILADRGLDARTLVAGNAYHEMQLHQLILAALRRALKPEGRLVIVEPVTASRRGRPRADEAKNHEIDPEYLLQDAGAAGFPVVALKDPFTRRDGDIEWLMTLRPDDLVTAKPTGTAPARESSDAEVNDPSPRIPLDELVALASKWTVTVVDVRDEDAFVAGHIPGAIWIPLPAVDRSVEQLRALAKPVVTYCS
jgi:rhodanese-related sulfurtransferase